MRHALYTVIGMFALGGFAVAAAFGSYVASQAWGLYQGEYFFAVNRTIGAVILLFACWSFGKGIVLSFQEWRSSSQAEADR